MWLGELFVNTYWIRAGIVVTSVTLFCLLSLFWRGKFQLVRVWIDTLSRLDWLAFRMHTSKTEIIKRALSKYEPED